MLSVCVSDLLDDGLHVDHPAGDAGGSLSGLEMDDPHLCRPEHRSHFPLQGETSPVRPPRTDQTLLSEAEVLTT